MFRKYLKTNALKIFLTFFSQIIDLNYFLP